VSFAGFGAKAAVAHKANGNQKLVSKLKQVSQEPVINRRKCGKVTHIHPTITNVSLVG